MEQRHPIYPSQLVSSPEDYPTPKAGPAIRLTLTTPEGETVGVLIYSDTGVSWTPADTESLSAQEHAAEVLSYLRGNREQGTDLSDVIDDVRLAYDGDFKEDRVRFIPEKK